MVEMARLAISWPVRSWSDGPACLTPIDFAFDAGFGAVTLMPLRPVWMKAVNRFVTA